MNRSRHYKEPDGHQLCTRCGDVKALNEFPWGPRGASWKQTVCRLCKKQVRQRRERDRAQAFKSQHGRSSRNLRQYGLSAAGYRRMVKQQNGLCAACGLKPQTRLVIGHDHSTGRVQGLICDPCNIAMGLAGDDPTRLRRLAEFIEAHRSSAKEKPAV